MKALWFRSALLAAALPACDDAVTPPATDAVGDALLADAGVEADDAAAPEADATGTAEDAVAIEDAPAPESDTSAPTDDATAPVADTIAPDNDASAPAEDVVEADTTAPEADSAVLEDTTPAPDDTSPPADDVTGGGTDTASAETVALASLLAPFEGSANGFETTPVKRLEGLVVTLVKPTVGNEAGGFFAQEGVSGPAVFVASATLPPEVVPGATLALVAERLRNNAGVPQIAAFSGLVRTATAVDLAPFRVNVDALTGAVDFRPRIRRLMAMSGEIADAGVAAGGGQGGYWRFGVTTPGLTAATSDVQLRLPRAIAVETGLEPGCLFEISDGAVWAFRSSGAGAPQIQPSVYAADAVFIVCATPTLSAVEATSPTTVVVQFSRPLMAASVDAADFAVSPTLAVEAVALSPDGRSATLTTAEHSPGLDYTVTMVGDATDVLGEGFADTGRSATFTSAEDTTRRAVFCFEDEAGTFTTAPTLAYGVTNARLDRIRLGVVSPAESVAGASNWSDTGAKNDPPECLAGDAAVSRSKAVTASGWSLDLDAADVAADAHFRVRFNAPAGVVTVSFDGFPSASGPRRLAFWNAAANAFVGVPLDVDMAWLRHPMYAATGGTSESNAALSFTIPDATATAFEFRIYPFAASAPGGTFRLDNLALRWAPLP